MEETLRKLLSNEKETIEEGTNELKEIGAKPDCVPQLLNVLNSCQHSEIRQYACILLRQRFSKPLNWGHLNNADKSNIKSGLIQLLMSEPEKMVKNSIAQLIGTLIKYELPEDGWPELVAFLKQMTTSPSMDDKELGFFAMSILLDMAPAEFFVHAPSFAMLFSNTFNTLPDKSCPVAFFIVVCMTHFGPAAKASKDVCTLFVDMIPYVIQTIEAHSTKRPDRAVDAMDFFYDFAEGEGMCVIVPRVKQIISFCLQLAESPNCDDDLKMKSISFIANMARLKMKCLVKNGLLQPILEVLFRLMCSKPEDEEEEEYFTSDPEEDTLLTCTCEVLDTIALNMDSKKLMKPVMDFVKIAVGSANVYEKKAGFLALGIICQGCESYIRNTCLDQFVSCVYTGVMNNQPVVRGAALFALGQFAEHLQPEISVHAQQLLPLLITQLGELAGMAKNGSKSGNRADRLFFAIERFCENLESALVPYLPSLISQLLPLCGDPYHTHLKELAMSCIGTIAGAVKEEIVPYFQQIMCQLNIYLLSNNESESSLQVEALEALAMLIRNVGEETFQAFGQESISLGLKLLSTSEDPDIRKSSFGLFAAVSSVMKESMGPVLPSIIDPLIRALKDDGYQATKEEESAFPEVKLDEDEDILSESDFSVENDYIEEKEEACMALCELAANTGEAFFPYLQTSFEEVFKLLEFPSSDVRRAALEAAFQFCITFAKITEQKENRDDLNLVQVSESLVNKANELIMTSDDRDEVIAGLEGMSRLLKEAGTRLSLSVTIKEKIFSAVKEVLNKKTEVQGWGENEDNDIDEEDIEIIDTAACVIPEFKHILNNQDFAAAFAEFLPLLNQRLNDTDEDNDNSYSKANAIGVIAECIPALGPNLKSYIPLLFSYLLEQLKDEDQDVRNNALFTIGEMAYHSKDLMFANYPQILSSLSQILANETQTKIVDNACGVIARLILVNASNLPLDQILPVFINKLPLKEDFEEDKWVYRSLGLIIQLNSEAMTPHIPIVFTAAAASLHSHTPDEETEEVFRNLLKLMTATWPDACSAIGSQLPPDVVASLNKALM